MFDVRLTLLVRGVERDNYYILCKMNNLIFNLRMGLLSSAYYDDEGCANK